MQDVLLQLDNLIPSVFSPEDCEGSEVWLQSLTIGAGERVLVEAGSGRGKSSLVSFIYGQRHDFSGALRLFGRDVCTLKVTDWDALRRTELAILFQELRLFPELTALENVEVKNRLTNHKTKAEIEALFERLGVAHRMHTPVARMSYGQQQRVALIRSLCQPFRLLLADEPISHLDEANACIMADIIRQEATAQGATVLVTSIGKHFDLDYTTTLHL